MNPSLSIKREAGLYRVFVNGRHAGIGRTLEKALLDTVQHLAVGPVATHALWDTAQVLDTILGTREEPENEQIGTGVQSA